MGLAVKKLDPSPLAMFPKADVLKMGFESLGGLRQERDDLDAMERRWVEHLRRAGATWSQIADALGVSRQAVEKRFAAVKVLADSVPDV